MMHRTHVRIILPVLVGVISLVCMLVPARQIEARSMHAGGPYYVTTAGGFAASTVWLRNFNPFLPTGLDSNTGGIYEPLYIITSAGGGHTYPWLATSYRWTDGNKTLLITIRHGVRWSDGTPFSAKDVVFTFNYGKKYAAADQNGLWGAGTLQSVNLVGSDQVAVHFKAVDTAALPYVVSNIRIIPEHIWSKITDPATFTNPNPVGTGPFTQIVKFTPEVYILGKNPYYWQKGKPAVDGLRMPFYSTASSNYLDLYRGVLDWTQDFVPNVQQTYVKRDPAHFHYFFATDTQPVGLFFNDTVYPFSLVGFRKAISQAIDRNKIWQIGEYGYEPPSDAIGVASAWPSWADKSLAAQARQLSTYDPQQAHAQLAAMHFTWKNGQLYDPRGHAVTIQIGVPHDWPDFDLDCQILQKEFGVLGITTNVTLMTDANWADKAHKGLLTAQLDFTNGGITPYYYFYGYMSAQSYVPTGQDASRNGQTNWERWSSPTATALLAQFDHTTDAATQHAIVDKLQQIQIQNLPFIPMVTGGLWYTYSTLHFTGWPTPSNYYAIGGPGMQYPDELKVETSLVPVK